VLEESQIGELLGNLSEALQASDGMMKKTLVGPFDPLSFDVARGLPFSGQLFHANGTRVCLGRQPLRGLLEITEEFGRTFNAMRIFSTAVALSRVLGFGVIVPGHLGLQAGNPSQALLGDSAALAEANVCMWPSVDKAQAVATLGRGEEGAMAVQDATTAEVEELFDRLRESLSSPRARSDLLTSTLAETAQRPRRVWTVEASTIFFLGLSDDQLLRPSDALTVHVEMPSLRREVHQVIAEVGGDFVGVHSRSHLRRRGLSTAAHSSTPATPVFVACALAVHEVPLGPLFLASDEMNPHLDDALRHLAQLLNVSLFSYSLSGGSGTDEEDDFQRIWNVLADTAILQRANWLLGSPLSTVDEYLDLRRGGNRVVLAADEEDRIDALSSCILRHRELDPTFTARLRVSR
jgi:hypothetical protein